jgi:hypothetical protein
MRAKTKRIRMPVGRAAMVAFQINLLRQECCEAASAIMEQKTIDEAELDECARLDDALDRAYRTIRREIAGITLSRLKRRSQAK